MYAGVLKDFMRELNPYLFVLMGRAEGDKVSPCKKLTNSNFAEKNAQASVSTDYQSNIPAICGHSGQSQIRIFVDKRAFLGRLLLRRVYGLSQEPGTKRFQEIQRVIGLCGKSTLLACAPRLH
jgi:hypothetical protein